MGSRRPREGWILLFLGTVALALASAWVATLA